MKSTLALTMVLSFAGRALAAEVDFEKQVAPLLAEKCLDCHNPRERKGKLDLSSRKSAFAGGDSGVVLVPGKVGESYLWDRVSGNEMPPKHPLTAEQKQILKQWIEEGAVWNRERIDPFAYTTAKRAGYDWWALKPLIKPAFPEPSSGPHPIDAFVREKLSAQNLKPSPRADRRTLIRRLSFDLLGLPPSPAEVEAFVADSSSEAYTKLVDRLLASPHYGERWARHWLDLARFGESQGFERDKLRDNAWPYRDWVIQALNEDMAYDRFVRLQIGGDVFEPGSADAIAATGFLVAGPYDEVGQNQQSAAMRAVVRQDEMEDYIGTVGQTFLGLTVNCARCHDHKFDPIRQSEYYQISAALAGVHAGDRPYQTRETERQLQAARQEQAQAKQEIKNLLGPVRRQILAERKQDPQLKAIPQPIARWTFEEGLKDDIGQLHGTAHGGAKIEDGRLILNGKDAYVSTAALTTTLTVKTLEAWVQLEDLSQRGGGVISVQAADGGVFDALVFGEQEPAHWMAGSNFFARTKSFGGDPEQQAGKTLVHVAIVYHKDGTIQAFRNGQPYGKPYQSSGPVTFEAGKSQVLFGLRHGTSAGGNRLLAGRIEQAQLYDKALSSEEIALTAKRFGVLAREGILAQLTADQKRQLAAWETKAAQSADRIASLGHRQVYAVAPKPPEATRVLLRGNPASPAEVVAAGGIESLAGISADFELAPDAPEGQRRKRLAEWITSPKNPLFARVIVNRLWHDHFGQGIVASPNDFGFNGSRPTHPALLDFLAASLIENRWSLKAVHRLIVTSETYRQSSKPDPKAMTIDAGNRWLWRYAPQRLEAEVIRDSLLKVSGRLNTKLGGPSYRNFETFNRNSQFYIMQDRTGPEYHRRTIYRMWVRSGRNRLLDALDCPDPSVTTPNRAVTTTPTQSLSLLNNSFVLRTADGLANRIEAAAPGDMESKVKMAYRLLFQRKPTPEELAETTAFAMPHGLPALVRVLFNTNEFLFAE